MSEKSVIKEDLEPIWKRKGFASESEYSKSKAEQINRISKKIIERGGKIIWGAGGSAVRTKNSVAYIYRPKDNKKESSAVYDEKRNKSDLYQTSDHLSPLVNQHIHISTKKGKVSGRIERLVDGDWKELNDLSLEQSISVAAKILKDLKSGISDDLKKPRTNKIDTIH